MHTDQGHWLPRYRLLQRHRGHRFDEHHASLLQSQGAGLGVCALWSLRASEGVLWAGARDQTQVLQGEVEDGRTGAVEAVGLLDGDVRRGGSSSRFVKTNAGGCNLLGEGRSGAC